MRPFVSFTFFSAATLVAADHTELIGNQDKRISYSNGWKFVSSYVIRMEASHPHPWSTQRHSANGDGGTSSFNDKGSGTASLRVYSESWCTLPMEKMLTKLCLDVSRIAVRLFVEASGQVVRISLDNKNYDITPLPYQQPAWTIESLDPSVPHDLLIIKRNPGGQYLELDYILVTYYDPPTTTGDQVTASAVPTSKVPNQLMPSAAAPAAASPPSTQTNSMGAPFSSGRLPSDSSPE
jgi:hypothetical protein